VLHARSFSTLFLLTAPPPRPTLNPPRTQVAQKWKFLSRPEAFASGGNKAEVLPRARVRDLGALLAKRGYQVFVQNEQLYAFKGMAGRLAPLGVHLALLLVLGGTAASGFGTFRGSTMIPEGQEFVAAGAMRAASSLGRLPPAAYDTFHVNSFDIDYRPNGEVAQFYRRARTHLPGNSLV